MFLFILGIESIILIPSAYNFRQNALRLLEQQAMALIQPVLVLEDIFGKPREAERVLRKLRDSNSLVAASIHRLDKTTLARIGDLDFSSLEIDDVLHGRRNMVSRITSEGAGYDLAWRAQVGGEQLVIMARMNSSRVRADLVAYILRIAGLVALIVAVVTMGTMMVLYRSVLSPILALRRSMLGASADPDHADDYQIRVRPENELGDVFLAHDEMLTRVEASKRADRLRAEERARFLARHDTLTGLPNRDFFLEHLRQRLSAAHQRGEEVEVLVLNLSGFSAVNHGLGQNVGDRVLIEVARNLSANIGKGQFVARLGGDQFGIASAGTGNPGRAAEYAERILAGVERPLVLAGHEIRLQGRIGIACSSTHGVDAETILHDAELALHRARSDSLARYQFFSPEMTQEVRRRQEIERDLRLALERGELQLFYQPKVRLTPNQPAAMRSCEALMRWVHPRLGWISPATFIPVAEATGLIIPMGEWALRETCAQVRRWAASRLALPRVAANLSAHQFRDPALPDRVRAAVVENGIDADLLELEITESVAMADVEQTVPMLAALRGVGVQLAIDDFGTGYSSLSYLRKFEIDSIKIDKSFVDDIGRDLNADAICDAIIRLGHSLGKRVVAEGVETPAQLEFLRLRRCDEAQGFLFAKPMPAAEVARRLA